MSLSMSKKICMVFLVFTLFFSIFLLNSVSGDEDTAAEDFNKQPFETKKEALSQHGINIKKEDFTKEVEGEKITDFEVEEISQGVVKTKEPPMSFTPSEIEKYCRNQDVEVDEGENCVNITKEGLVFKNGAKLKNGSLSFDEKGNMILEGMEGSSPEADLRKVDLNTLKDKGVIVKGDNAVIKTLEDKYTDQTFMVKSPGEKLIHVRATQPVSVEKMQNGKYVSIGDLKKGIMATNEKSGIRQFNEKNLDFDVSNPNTGNILGNIKNQNFVMSDHTTDFNPGDYNGEKGPLLNVRGFGNGQYSLESSVYKNQKFELSNVPEDGIFIANINGKDSKIIENRKGNIKIKHDNQGTKINGKNLGELSDKKVDKLRKKGFAGLSETRVDEKTSAIKWDSEEGAMEISPLNGEEVDKQKNEIVKDKKEETTKEDTDTEDKEGTEEEKKDKEKTQQTEKADEEELEKKEPKKSKLEVKSEGKAKEKQGSYRQIEKVEEDKKNKLKDYLDKNLPSASNKENAIYEEGTSLVIGGKRFDVYDGYVNRKFEQDNREIMTMSDGTSLIYDKNKGEVYYSDKEGNWYKVQVEKGKTITKNWL